jgi:histidinol-phosphate phosphatase family protein
MARRAVFLDRDGVLNEAVVRDGKPYPPATPGELRIIPGTREALARLKQLGFLLLVVTNQPDVARGSQSREAVDAMHRDLRNKLPLDAVFTCFHDDKDSCDCRKPRPGLVTRAAKEFGIDLAHSYLAGDRWRDVDAGANAGCRTIWIDRGYQERSPNCAPDAHVKSLDEAVDWILATEAKSTHLLTPANDVASPELSIVIPALNEELTIARFVEWCHQGLKDAGIEGEIVIIDSSTDRTSEIALSRGARVLKTPKRGLGRAYIDAVPYIRGKYVVMGDADCTYDFRILKPFMERFHQGYEYVMGSRFRGYIEPGSMPPLHQYFGTPLTTWILNFLYGSHFSDIHCGMRGITRSGLMRMDLQSQSWEYASEMVLKSVRMPLRTAEVPVRFLKDQEGRFSHHKRSGWFSPWHAAWINLKAMFIYGADFFLFRPGMVLLVAGLLLTLPMTLGPVQLGPITLSLYWMLFGLSMSVLGLHGFYVGALARVFFDYSGDVRKKWLRRFSYTRSVVLSAVSVVAGAGLAVPLVMLYVRQGFRLSGEAVFPANHLAVAGLLFVIGGFMNFTFTLALHAAAANVRRNS